MARLPDGQPAPADGVLPQAALAGLGTRPLGLYVHVPFCAARCGYCDFNTYVDSELPAGTRTGFAASLRAELELAARVLGPTAPPVSTVFFGGGTPTLLAPAELASILAAARELFGLAPEAEVTAEANPESVGPRELAALREAGFTRISLGMQSASAHVLATLDRVHSPGRAAAAAQEARAAGFGQVSLDLIYGTPGESDDDWRATVAAALDAGPDHVSAYALTLEAGTRMHAQVRRGSLPPPDDDALARRYEIADRALSRAGLEWYEVSNWARGPAARCRHNLGYWRSHDWWGAGPGAHSHIGGVRWWNRLHPSAWSSELAAGRSPAAGRERLEPAVVAFERTMLGLRLREGLALAELGDEARPRAAQLADDGLLDAARLGAGRAELTLRGRLLADAAVRALT